MRSAFQILKDSFSKILDNPVAFLSIIALPAVIAAGASFIEPATDFEGNYIWNSSAHVYQYSVVMIVFVVVSMFMTIAATLVAQNKELGAKEAYSMAIKKALSYIVMMLISGLVLICAITLIIPGLLLSTTLLFPGIFLTICLTFPGVWLSVSLMFASYFLILRGSSPVDSLKMSFRLVKGRWWTVFLKSLMFGFLYLLIAIPVLIALGAIGNFVGDDVSYAVESVFGVLGSLFTIVFIYEFFTDLERTQSTVVQASPIVPEAPASGAATV